MTDLIAASDAMRETLSAALDVAAAPTTVLLVGESGTGKELIAQLIHRESPRAAAPLTFIRCGNFSVTETEAALRHGGTVVFDEISALTIEQQGHLLRLIESPHASRLVATSNRHLGQLVERGALRADLYYRLDVFPIRVPPLRERRADLRPLAQTLLADIGRQLGRGDLRLSDEGVEALEQAEFHGNVRELANVLERAAIRAREATLGRAELALPTVSAVPDHHGFPPHLPLSLADLERVAIAEALRRVNGNRTHAARLLGIGLRTLRQKLNGPPAAARENALEAS